MTCDTAELQNRGVSFALAEAELVWPQILDDAVDGELRPTYGDGTRWQDPLEPPPLIPPPESNMRRYAVQMLGVHPARAARTGASSARSSRSPATACAASQWRRR